MSRLRTLDHVRERADRHAVRVERVGGQWPAVSLRPCPCCGEGAAIAEHDGFGVIAYCMGCGGDVAGRLVAEPGPAAEDLVDLLLDLVFVLVGELARREVTA